MRPNVHHLLLNFFYKEERGRRAGFEEVIFQLTANEFIKLFLTLVQVKTQDTDCSPFSGFYLTLYLSFLATLSCS